MKGSHLRVVVSLTAEIKPFTLKMSERSVEWRNLSLTVHIPTSVKDPERIRDRRAQIIEAAVRLFSEKGFHKATTRELAKASGLSNGALYEYVESKEDILYLVCQYIHEEMHARLQHSLSQEGTARHRLSHAISSFFQVIRDMQDEVLLIYQESRSLPAPFLRDVLAQEQEIARVFEHLLYEGEKDDTLRIPASEVPVLAHDIVVMGQMWAFRRWALQAVSFEEFSQQQIDLLLRMCTRDADSEF